MESIRVFFCIVHLSYGRNYLFGEYAISKYGGPLSVVRVLYVPDINVKAEDARVPCSF